MTKAKAKVTTLKKFDMAFKVGKAKRTETENGDGKSRTYRYDLESSESDIKISITSTYELPEFPPGIKGIIIDMTTDQSRIDDFADDETPEE